MGAGASCSVIPVLVACTGTSRRTPISLRINYTWARYRWNALDRVLPLAGLDADVEVTMFLQPGSNLYDPAKELLERYAAKSPRVSLRTVDPQRNLIEAQRLVDELQLSSLNVVVFEAGGDRRVVEASLDACLAQEPRERDRRRPR